jgi:hypothetical protein
MWIVSVDTARTMQPDGNAFVRPCQFVLLGFRPGALLRLSGAQNTTFFQAVFIFYQDRVGLAGDDPLGADLPRRPRASRRRSAPSRIDLAPACLAVGMLLPAVASGLLLWSPTLAIVVVAETLFATGTALRSGRRLRAALRSAEGRRPAPRIRAESRGRCGGARGRNHRGDGRAPRRVGSSLAMVMAAAPAARRRARLRIDRRSLRARG